MFPQCAAKNSIMFLSKWAFFCELLGCKCDFYETKSSEEIHSVLLINYSLTPLKLQTILSEKKKCSSL